MRKKLILSVTILLMIVVYLFTPPQTIFAHKMIIDHVEDGLLLVRYDDGSPAVLAEVTLYDNNGEILAEKEKVDENGYLQYDHQLYVHRIIADDGMGHRVSSLRNDDHAEKVPRFVKALLGLSILGFIAAIFFFRTKRK